MTFPVVAAAGRDATVSKLTPTKVGAAVVFTS